MRPAQDKERRSPDRSLVDFYYHDMPRYLLENKR